MGKTIKMEGRVSGSQPLTIKWYKDHNEIHASKKYDMTFKNNMAVLYVKDSAHNDSGVYDCEASNEAGTASFKVSLKVSGKGCVYYLSGGSKFQSRLMFCRVSLVKLG